MYSLTGDVVDHPVLSSWVLSSRSQSSLGSKADAANFTQSTIAIEILWSVRDVVPIFPIPLGFAINTIFYAAILWLLFAVPGFVRRRIRIKRGLCQACGYPIGTSDVCTECGAPLRRFGQDLAT